MDTEGRYPDINWYIHRSVGLTMVEYQKVPAVYWKMPRICVISVMDRKYVQELRAYSIHAKNGILNSMKGGVPNDFMQFIFDCSLGVTKVKNGLSQKQLGKINQTYRQNIDRFAESPSYLPALADYKNMIVTSNKS